MKSFLTIRLRSLSYAEQAEFAKNTKVLVAHRVHTKHSLRAQRPLRLDCLSFKIASILCLRSAMSMLPIA